jgi:tRNA pseudouridine38-40 synthase
VQGDLESALTRLLRTDVTLSVAGRTDAGVHALGQVVGLHGIPEDEDRGRLKLALNRMCAPSIVVFDVSVVPEEWHARFSALSRTYVYAVLNSELHDPWLARTSLHHPGRLDVEAMNEGAGHLIGLHDFTSFGRLPDEEAAPERRLYELSWTRRGSLLRMTVRANAFIRQMARSIAGTLLEVGAGSRSPDELPATLEARDRNAVGRVAPPHGLCLTSVEYADGWSGPFDPPT